MKIHFADCIGSGCFDTGGLHGTNFSMNKPLMKNLLDAFLETRDDFDLVLEVGEIDNRFPLNAIALANEIDDYIYTKKQKLYS